MSMNANWHLAASFRRDSSVTETKLPPGTVRRIVRFAAPYKRLLVWFLLLVVLDAVIGAVNPLIVRAIIDEGIEQAPGRAHRRPRGDHRDARRSSTPPTRWPTGGSRRGSVRA